MLQAVLQSGAVTGVLTTQILASGNRREAQLLEALTLLPVMLLWFTSTPTDFDDQRAPPACPAVLLVKVQLLNKQRDVVQAMAPPTPSPWQPATQQRSTCNIREGTGTGLQDLWLQMTAGDLSLALSTPVKSQYQLAAPFRCYLC